MNQLVRKTRIDDHGCLRLDAPAEWAGRDVEVTVTLRDEPPAQSPEKTAERRRKLAEALQKLADLGGIQSIPDPVAWQREIRKDRPLPGREE